MTKKKLTYITILGACIAAGVFVTVPSQAVSDEGKSKAMIMLEKAKAARLERKKALENKRNEMEQYYSDKTGHKYKVNVFFEGEMVDSDALNQWVPNGYNAVLFSNNDSKAQKILVSNSEKMVTAYIDFTKEINDKNQKTFCKTLYKQAKTNHSLKVLSKATIYTGKDSSVCQFALRDKNTNLFAFESYELYKDGSLAYVHTLGKNEQDYISIIKDAFPRTVADKARKAVSHALGEFLSTESYKKTQI